MQSLDDRGIERAADVLERVGRHHRWWPQSLDDRPWRDRDPIGRSEYLGIVEEMVRAYLTSSGEGLGKSAEPHLIIDMTLYPTNHSGRAGPILGRYGCVCKFHPDDATGWDGFVFLADDKLAPGETKRLGMTFLTPAVATLFRNYRKFYLWERGIIGEAVPALV
jgi:hypothetical protein